MSERVGEPGDALVIEWRADNGGECRIIHQDREPGVGVEPMRTSTTLRRLRKLADHIARVPRREFDMGSWRCGTKHCIGGHAALLFPREMKFVTFDGGNYILSRRAVTDDDIDPFYAFAEAFGITIEDAEDLCDPFAAHQTPKAAARAIRRLADRIEKAAAKEARDG